MKPAFYATIFIDLDGAVNIKMYIVFPATALHATRFFGYTPNGSNFTASSAVKHISTCEVGIAP